MKRKETFYLVLTAILSAIIIVMGQVPFLGFIPMGIVSITLLHVPVLIGLMILPLKYSLFLGFMFGLNSFAVAHIRPSGPLDYAAKNFIQAVLPRVLFALGSFYILKLFSFIVKKSQKGEQIIFIFTSILTTLVIFLSINFLVSGNNINESWVKVLMYSLSLLLSVGIILIYFYFIYRKKTKYVRISATFLLGTLLHTLLFLITLITVKPSIFYEVFGDGGVTKAILGALITFGISEGLVAALIGTPIYIAIEERMGFNDIIS